MVFWKRAVKTKITGRLGLIALAMCGIYVISFPVLGAFLEPRGVPTSVIVDIIGVIETISFIIMVRLMHVTTDEWKKGITEVFSLTPQKLKGLFLIVGMGLLVIFVLCEAEGMRAPLVLLTHYPYSYPNTILYQVGIRFLAVL